MGKPFPKSWQRILENEVPYYQKLPPHYRDILKQRMMIFLNEKLFEVCGGLQITERVKVIISAYACVLLLEEESDYYPDLQSILVYPDDYVAPLNEEDEAGVITTGSEARKGESWTMGSIILSWNDLEENIYNDKDNQNLIFHEFSHQLDQHYGLTAGITAKGKVTQRNEWNNIIASSLKDLRRKVKRKEASILDEYGATEPAEFFSVATEAFFEDSKRFSIEYTQLYKLLERFYRVSPERW